MDNSTKKLEEFREFGRPMGRYWGIAKLSAYREQQFVVAKPFFSSYNQLVSGEKWVEVENQPCFAAYFSRKGGKDPLC